MVAAGEACIKAEYIIPKVLPPTPDQLKQDPPLPSEDGKEGDGKEGDGKEGDGKEGGTGKSAKRKRGGQNKKRRAYKQPMSEMICQFVVREAECPMKERCKKIHDRVKFMEGKGPDIGDECFYFQQYGRCPYGIACRFGASHLDGEFLNTFDDIKYEKMKVFEVKKTLLKELQIHLRSRRVWFGKTYKALEGTAECKNELKQHLEKFRKSKRVKTTASRDSLDNPGNDNENKATSVSDLDNKTDTEKEGKVGDENQNGRENGRDCVTASNQSVSNSTPTYSEVYEEIKDDYYCFKSKTNAALDIRGKLFLSPLTTVGNLPFRRICKEFGVDVTCGEMALCEELLQGQMSEWALLKRHHSEDMFGVQICANQPYKAAKVCELISSECDVDFIDLNVGCPIDMIFNKGAGSALMDRAAKLENILTGMVATSDVPISVKMRMGTCESRLSAINLCGRLKKTGISHIVVHGRTRQQRYTKLADWDYIKRCKEAANPITLFGNGDVLSFEDYYDNIKYADGVMIGRGALIKPWIFKEIKEQRHWDISSTERMEILRKFSSYGLEHWGSDTCGVEKTRRFLLEWMSFLYRYIPVGVLEVLPQRINERPPWYHGRDETETLMCSANAADWVRLSEMLLGKVPDGFNFIPKHAANSYS